MKPAPPCQTGGAQPQERHHTTLHRCKQIRDLIDGVYSEKAGKEAEKLERDAMQRAQVEEMSEKDISREIKRLEKLMMEHARNLEFEKAARVRDQLAILKEQAFGAPDGDNIALL